jgi:hypothetical protein
MTMRPTELLMLSVAFLLLSSGGSGQPIAAGTNSVTSGELVVDPPTLINLGFEWLIDGDDNRNARVEVSYRKQSETQWKPALPMLRLQGERIYNGFRPNAGAEIAFEWNSPGPGVVADYTDGDHRAALETRRFKTLAEYSQATAQDRHSVLVDYDVFVNVPRLGAQDVRTVQKMYKAEDFDFRLKPDGAAVDRGVALPNVNEGFAGRAPDLGALEVGRPAPHFGPRP